jgi:hypothetical protein
MREDLGSQLRVSLRGSLGLAWACRAPAGLTIWQPPRACPCVRGLSRTSSPTACRGSVCAGVQCRGGASAWHSFVLAPPLVWHMAREIVQLQTQGRARGHSDRAQGQGGGTPEGGAGVPIPSFNRVPFCFSVSRESSLFRSCDLWLVLSPLPSSVIRSRFS